jgi:hypothetical protein
MTGGWTWQRQLVAVVVGWTATADLVSIFGASLILDPWREVDLFAFLAARAGWALLTLRWLVRGEGRGWWSALALCAASGLVLTAWHLQHNPMEVHPLTATWQTVAVWVAAWQLRVGASRGGLQGG